MSIVHVGHVSLSRSRLAESVDVTLGRNISTPLARVVAEENEARAWRVALGRLERRDGAAPLVQPPSSPLFPSVLYSYAAGTQPAPPVFPPSRDNPVARSVPGTDIDPIFVEIAWGMASGSLQRMLAHWPAQGASVVVYGNYVEVFSGTSLDYGTTPIGGAPKVQASIIPADGLAVSASGELGISQVDTIGSASELDGGVVLFVPDYAREVRVSLSPNLVAASPITFQPSASLLWWDDRGPNLVDMVNQGTAAAVPATWQKVPPQATMLQVISHGATGGQPEFADAGLFVHWRLAP